jgi:murein DD-endopeptidase MepM/ murein hydrolase activator NlpD
MLERKRRVRTGCLVAVAAAASFALAVEPSAGAGGAMAPGGGAMFVEKPKLAKVSCLRRCASRKRAKPGSTLKITGSGLSEVRKLTFHGSFGARDDVEIPLRSGSPTRLNARVPLDAVTGAVSVKTDTGLSSRRTRAIQILPPPPPDPNPTLTPVPGFRQRGAPQLETGTSRTRAFFGARRTVVFSYRIGALAQAARVELVRARDGVVVQTWNAPPPAAGAVKTIVWNGVIAGIPAPPGRYSFRLTVAAPTGALARSAQVGNLTRDAFDLYDHQFPIRGAHNYGGAGAVFGTGRAGHSHQGHDVFARCGVPMVAARGGRVKFKGYHRAAGNYLVIDGDRTGVDYAYMHLAEPSPFAARDRVYTGQRIGAVGETGNARGCHLHFELWNAPGWYDGGRPFNPLPSLRAWDAYS